VESLGGEDKFYEQLRENKKRLNWKDDRGRGAVHSSCWGPRGGREGKKNGGKTIFDCDKSLEYLIDAGADVNIIFNCLFLLIFNSQK
jgi:hypothetical protein